jgi:hypothetical protein
MSSSGVWRCVDPGLTDVSEDCIASIFRVICPAKPLLTEDVGVVQKEEFSVPCYMCEMYS